MGGWLKLERPTRLTPSPHPRCRLRSISAGEVSAYRSAALFDDQWTGARGLGLPTHLFSIHSLQRPNLEMVTSFDTVHRKDIRGVHTLN